jgi:hypothetical protein
MESKVLFTYLQLFLIILSVQYHLPRWIKIWEIMLMVGMEDVSCVNRWKVIDRSGCDGLTEQKLAR